jgi:dTDP-4-amino-4,6-dideoxygalactose transaminase
MVREFEERIAELVDSPYVVATNSGTSALYLALQLAGVGPGTEVVSTPATAIPTNASAAALGARIRWADIDPSTGLIDPTTVGALTGATTKAVLAVDLGGAPAAIDEIRDAVPDGVAVIEDAAQALGASRHGRPVGADAHFMCLSFQATKLLTCGDGGALVCTDERDYERAIALRWFGVHRRTPRQRFADLRALDFAEAGLKLHMNDVSAAIGIGQLSHVDDLLARNRRCAARLTAALSPAGVETSAVSPGSDPSWWSYWILVEDPEAVEASLAADDIDASQLMPRNDRLTAFGPADRDLPGVDAFFERALAIPCGWWLDNHDIDRVATAVIAAVGASRPRTPLVPT